MVSAALKYVPPGRYEEELHSVMLECFPDFWRPRFAAGNFAFPYDVKMFLFSLDGEKAGQGGFHPCAFAACGKVWETAGLCDVGILPSFRGKGYSRLLQKALCSRIRKRYNPLFIPLYTDKPGVYAGEGFTVYSSRPDGGFLPEISEEKVRIQGKRERLNASPLPLWVLRRKPLWKCTNEEMKKRRIHSLYCTGHTFPGKCVRSDAVWDELFRDGDSEWILGEDRYFLFRKGKLLEAYTSVKSDKINLFTPRHGGQDENKVMVKLCRKEGANREERKLIGLLKKGEFVFPLTDVF